MIIRATALRPVPWRNGRGITRDIITRLAPGGALLWQVSIADLAQDAPFSDYANYDRIFTPIAGDPPPELAFHGGPFEPCPLLVPKHFAGETPTLSRIPAPGRAFNAIVDRRHYKANVVVLQLSRDETLKLPSAPDLVLHCLTGLIIVDGERLGPGDSQTGAAPASAQALQPGTAIIVTIEPI